MSCIQYLDHPLFLLSGLLFFIAALLRRTLVPHTIVQLFPPFFKSNIHDHFF